MPDRAARLERMEQAIHSLTEITAEFVRENRAFVHQLVSDRALFRETRHGLKVARRRLLDILRRGRENGAAPPP